jgi:RNA polymerase-binding protein DksA
LEKFQEIAMDTKQIAAKLNELKAELEARVQRTHKHTYQKDEPVSAKFDEQVVETENDGLVMALEAEGKEELALIDKALQRIEEGSYGQCQRCGEEIDEARLQAVPYAALCIDCAN